MKYFYFLLLMLFQFNFLLSNTIEIANDNGQASGHFYQPNRNYWEESVELVPDGPCKILALKIYYLGDTPANDTIYICGMPTAGNIYPTHYIWEYNTLIDPIIYEYDGNPGWKEIDISQYGLRSDGYDKFVIQHFMKPNGPWFAADNDGLKGLSWLGDPYTPNTNFYNIRGTIFYKTSGDFLVRLLVEYDYPIGNSSLPPPPPKLVNVTAQAGLSGSGEIAVADWNNDGFDDIFVGGNFFENQGDGTFRRVNTKLNITASAVQFADINNNGWLDVYAMVNGAFNYDLRMEFTRDQIYMNQGDGTFKPVRNQDLFALPYPDPLKDFKIGTLAQDSIFNPYNTCTPVWFDFDGDGNLDLYIANRRIEISGKPEIYCPDQLWLYNQDDTFNEDGMFINIRQIAQMDKGEPYNTATAGYYDVYGASAVDYNNDGKTDIFVATYRLAPDLLYKNNGDYTFTNVAAETGVRGAPTAAPNYFGHGMGSDWGDFNNDGFIDLCIGNLAHTDSRGSFSNPSLIFKNEGPPDFKFSDVRKKMGLKFHEGNAGALWLDLDLDGYLDLWHGKYSGGFGVFYLNQGPPEYRLLDITWEVNAVIDNPWTAARIDFDNDGDLDIIVAGRLLRNDLPRKGNWLALRLSGDPNDNVNMGALGSRVNVYADGKLFHRQLAGSSIGTHASQSSFELHFGIGNNAIADSILIYYSNGKVNKLTNIPANRRYRVPYMSNAIPSIMATPALESPQNFAQNQSRTPILSWYESGGAIKYIIQLANNASFTSNIAEGKFVYNFIENGTILNIADELESGVNWYWRAKAVWNNGNDTTSWSSVWSFFVGTPIPSTPELLYPNDGSINISVYTILEWTKSEYTLPYLPAPSYDLRIALDEDFTNIIAEYQGLANNSYTMLTPLPTGMLVYLQVRAVDINGEYEWSEARKFSTLPLPQKPTLVVPKNNEKYVEQRPYFSWNKIQNVLSYLVQIDKTELFTEPIYDRNDIMDTVFRVFSPRLDANEVYYWRVAARNEGGAGVWSDVWSFSTDLAPSVYSDDDSEKLQIEAYPNPTSDMVNIRIFTPTSTKLHLSIFDELGKEVAVVASGNYIDGIHQFKHNCASIVPGVYFIRLSANEETVSKKFVIQR